MRTWLAWLVLTKIMRVSNAFRREVLCGPCIKFQQFPPATSVSIAFRREVLCGRDAVSSKTAAGEEVSNAFRREVLCGRVGCFGLDFTGVKQRLGLEWVWGMLIQGVLKTNFTMYLRAIRCITVC